MANKIKWEDADFKWELAPTQSEADRYTWDSVLEIVDAIDKHGGPIIEAVKDLDKDKKKKLVRLVMHRNNIKVYDEAKEVKNITAHVDDIEMIVTEAKARLKMEKLHV